MTTTKVTRCAAASCRTLTASKYCEAHRESQATTPQPAFDPEVYLAPIRAEWGAMNARREQERVDAVGARAMLRHQLEVMGRLGENRQPAFTRGRDHDGV